jgi:hypothetical protein
MVNYYDLRCEVEGLEKIAGCKRIERPPLINNGFPGQFNLSFTEQPWLDEYGSYIDFNHDYIFSTTPSCIRFSDMYDEVTKKSNLMGENSWKYLGVFEMSDLAGMGSFQSKQDIYSLQKKQAKNLIDLLDKYGIDKKRLFPTYQPSANLRDVPSKKRNYDYPFDFKIPEDAIGKNVFLDLGIPEENITPDYSGSTLLRLYLSKRIPGGLIRIPSPWGYRNEIDIDVGTKNNLRLLDVATLERATYKPVIRDNTIIGLSDINDTITVGAVGLERLCMVVNGLSNVREIDYIKDFYLSMPKIDNSTLVGEYLRALHRICSDLPLAKRRFNFNMEEHHHTNKRYKKIRRVIKKSGLDTAQIKDLLLINAEIQYWHPELKEGVDITINELDKYRL